MAINFDKVSETTTAGNQSVASFNWGHGSTASPRGVLVFTFVNANADDVTSVTYGGVNVPAVSSGRANTANATAPGDCKAWFLGSGVPSGNQTVVVNRNNNTNNIYACAITVTADADTQVIGVTTDNADLVSGGAALDEKNISATSGETLRFAALNCGISGWNNTIKGGASNNVTSGASSDWADGSADFLGNGATIVGVHIYTAPNRGCGTVRGTAKGSGNIGFSGNYVVAPSGNTGRAAVFLGVTEITAARPPNIFLNTFPGIPLTPLDQRRDRFPVL